jgi:beta-glucosidase
MVFNEPSAFTALGYLIGYHAPGLKGFKNFLPTVHHVCLAQAEGSYFLQIIKGANCFKSTFIKD